MRRRLANGFRSCRPFRLADDFGAGSARKVSELQTRRCRGSRRRTVAVLPARLGEIGARHPGRGPGCLAKLGTSTLARLAPANGSYFAARHWRSSCQSRCIKTLASQSQRLSSCLASSADPVPPAAWPDSAAFRPLHFTAATANDGGALSFRSDGRKLTRPDETGRVPQVARGDLVAPLLARLIRFPQLFHRWGGEPAKARRSHR